MDVILAGVSIGIGDDSKLFNYFNYIIRDVIYELEILTTFISNKNNSYFNYISLFDCYVSNNHLMTIYY